MTDMVDAARVRSALAEAVQYLGTPQDEEQALAAIVNAAVHSVPGAEQAGVALVHRDGSIASRAPSSDTVIRADQLQAELGEGPCLTALWDERTVVIDDVAAQEHRWPRFAPYARALGIGSLLSFRLFLDGDRLGALNLYAAAAAFTTESQTIGGLFATHAAPALGHAQHEAQMQQALASRDVIGQAKGILMERFGLTADEAFALLVDSSQRTHLKLVQIARWLAGGEPAEPPPERC